MRIGTRGSALALIQAEWVAARLAVPVEIVTITTLGDRGAAIEDKSRWVSELERALLDDRIDLAVHSAKDVPTELHPSLEIVAVPERGDARDAICGAHTLEALTPGARIGTSSVRRRAQIRAVRDDVDVVELRGNVDTRLRKLADGQVDALVLALAGLQRLGRAGECGGALTGLVPAAGQGALALEGRAGELDDTVLAPVCDPLAMACLTAERSVVRALGASCHTPVGVYARPVAGGDQLELSAWVGVPDGSAWLTDHLTGASGSVGTECAQRMLAAGAAELLAQAERELAA
ncbi:MAG: hydroxymethylbilane synthase [Solirubrobacteraceae bacterium]|jgi:hydroxymethylbilane synthase|nr:hydroxymethylbilane synthase [Solirubrobacteraceae bacterium]